MNAKQFLDLDFFAAVGAATYATLVTLVPALQPMAEVFATAEAAVSFAGLALVRFAVTMRGKGVADDAR